MNKSSSLAEQINTLINMIEIKYFDCLIKLGFNPKYSCPVCQKKIIKFKVFPKYYLDNLKRNNFIYDINDFETLNIKNNTCPYCLTGDGNRLCALYLHKKLSRLNKKKRYKFIDFAPVQSLSKLIKSYKSVEYRSADLYMENVDDKVDISNMKIYKDKSVDIFLCSHVLEHVEDDNKAIRELHRILNDDGWGIIMVPIMLSISKVQENKKYTCENDRWKHFAQGDHVRLYSKNGFIKRLEGGGFKVRALNIDYFGKNNFRKFGISTKSVLYIVSK